VAAYFPPVRMMLQATAIELASWRETQIAKVDFTNLKIKERVCRRKTLPDPVTAPWCRVFSQIGQGASGEVFRGVLNGTTVAVKVASCACTHSHCSASEASDESWWISLPCSVSSIRLSLTTSNKPSATRSPCSRPSDTRSASHLRSAASWHARFWAFLHRSEVGV